jgi:CubicO group peptidase (beta-lactamase class C family)
VSDPQAEGVDPLRLNRALDAGESLPYLYALLVVKNGVLIGERYYGETVPTDANTVMSVSKSVLSALVGLALDQGHLDIDQSMLEFFPEYADDSDSRKTTITIRQLLTMTAGFPRDEYAEEWSRWLQSPNWLEYCLSQALVDDPGEAWHYSTCSTHIVSALLARATGLPTRRFARRYLFRPLSIQIGGWPTDPQGIHRGGWDMYLTPRDLARFGHLYLEKGKLGRKRLIPRRWVRKTTRSNIRGSNGWGPLDSWGYGHWWWTARGATIPKIYFALGYGGQFVVNVPSLSMTIVAAADGNFGPDEANEHETEILELIVERILEPLSGAHALE